MLTRMLSRLRRIAPSNRPAPKPRARLNCEALEAREVPATLIGLDNANNLLRFDSATPTTVQSTAAINVTAGERVVGIDFRPRTGQLYALTVDANGTGTNARLYTVNAVTGAATRVGTGAVTVTADPTAAYGFDFNPTVDRIRVVNAMDANFRINPNTGARADTPVNDTTLNPAGNQIDGVAYDRNFDGLLGAAGTTLYAINANTGMLQTQGGVNQAPSPNGGLLINVGALNVTIDPNSFVGFDIGTPATTGGPSSVFAVLDGNAAAGIATGLYRINLTTGAATLVGLVGTGTATLTGLAVVPEGTLVVGSGQGANGDVRFLDPTTGAVRSQVVPFAGFQGGVRVAAGDINRDGIPDAAVSAVAANGHVKVFNGATGQQLTGPIGSFLAFQGYNGNVNVGIGDVNGDGFADVLVVANGANGHVKLFSGADGSLIGSFLAFQGFLGNATVSSADFNNDGTDEIVVGAAINGHVKVFNRDGTAFVAGPAGAAFSSFLAYPGFTTGPIGVAAGDVNGDGTSEIVTISGTGSRGHVKAFSGVDSSLVANFLSSTATLTSSPSIGLADSNLDGVLDIRVTPGSGQPANVQTFDLFGMPLGTSFPAFAGFQGGATIGGARV